MPKRICRSHRESGAEAEAVEDRQETKGRREQDAFEGRRYQVRGKVATLDALEDRFIPTLSHISPTP
jgi:hypothetical protein